MEMNTAFTLLLTMLTGLVAGFLNVTAGGGTILTLPILNFIGLDLGVANATNRVSILFQNLSAIRHYHQNGKIDWREAATYIFPAIAGAILGTLSAVYMPPRVFRIIAAISIFSMGILLVAKPKMWDAPQGEPLSLPKRIAALFLVGIYGGFLQAGVGFLLIWAISGGCKKNLREANVLKITIVAFYTMASLALFASFGMVNWTAAFALALGSVIGGNAGARFNLKANDRVIRWILTGVVLISSIKMMIDAFR
ncbi:MAG: sulfite exporter TauE/SafE family protein [Synergistaceae bacterium]|nr:sulfite exporter TauE/SafE family protein [Synergistaceae bacterium]